MDSIGSLFDAFADAYSHSLFAIEREEKKLILQKRMSPELLKKIPQKP